MEAALVESGSASPNDRWVISGPFRRIHDRDELFDDLEYAVKPRTAPTVLVLLGFLRLKERLEAMLEPDGNVLLGRIAKRLEEASATAAVLYEPRRGDFCGLFYVELEQVSRSLLRSALRSTRSCASSASNRTELRGATA
jgi:hypothetical protein